MASRMRNGYSCSRRRSAHAWTCSSSSSAKRGGCPLRELSPGELGGNLLHTSGGDTLVGHLHGAPKRVPSPTAGSAGREQSERSLPDLAVLQVQSCLLALSVDAHTFRSGIPVDPRSPRRARPSGARSSRPAESGSLVGSSKTAIPRSPWSNSWIFSASISISKVAIVVLLGC